MACTLANLLTDSCKCLGTTEVCGADSYCYEGQCTAENRCGDGLCETECMCGGDGKIASKCLGNNKYCKNGRVMTLCTADSLATEECTCTAGDEGICGGRCADGNCYGNACRFEDNSESSCVCAPEGKKVGVYKKTYGTVCRSTGTLVAIAGGCEDSMTIDQVCKCGNEEDDCASGSICSGSGCFPDKCAEGECSCDCVGDQKNAEACTDSDTNQCKGGKVVPLDNKLVCTAEHGLYSYCQCSSETTTLCAVYGICVGGDCYDEQQLLNCTKDVPVAVTCKCKTTNKISTIAKTGDICNTDGTVSKKCADGVPSQIDACFCGSKEGPECKNGDVCIVDKCYGADSAATANYCEYGKPCDPACACADISFTQVNICDGSDSVCIDGQKLPACPAGQGYEGQICKPCDTDCLECAEKRSVCTKCADKFKLEGGKCNKVSDEGKNNIGLIAGIVVAVVIVLAAVAVGVFFFLKHRKQEEKKVDYQEDDENDVQVAAE